MITIHIPGTPVPKGRARGVMTKHGRPLFYTPQKTRSWERMAAQVAKIAMRGQKPLTGPLEASVEAIFPYPATWGKNKKLLSYPSKIDLDNIFKAASDAMNKIVYTDDAQIVRLTASKAYGDEPGVTITIVNIGLDEA